MQTEIAKVLALQASRAGAEFELLTVVESQMLRASENLKIQTMSNIEIIKGSFDTQIELKVERLLIAETTYIGE